MQQKLASLAMGEANATETRFDGNGGVGSNRSSNDLKGRGGQCNRRPPRSQGVGLQQKLGSLARWGQCNRSSIVRKLGLVCNRSSLLSQRGSQCRNSLRSERGAAATEARLLARVSQCNRSSFCSQGKPLQQKLALFARGARGRQCNRSLFARKLGLVCNRSPLFSLGGAAAPMQQELASLASGGLLCSRNSLRSGGVTM